MKAPAEKQCGAGASMPWECGTHARLQITGSPRAAFGWQNSCEQRASIVGRKTRQQRPTMPPAKRVKSSGAARPAAGSERPSTDDIEGQSEFATLARQHWLKTMKRTAKMKVKNDVLKREIWDALEKDNFPLKSLLVLEALQTLERYAIDRLPRLSSPADRNSLQLPVARLHGGFVKLSRPPNNPDRQCEKERAAGDMG